MPSDTDGDGTSLELPGEAERVQIVLRAVRSRLLDDPQPAATGNSPCCFRRKSNSCQVGGGCSKTWSCRTCQTPSVEATFLRRIISSATHPSARLCFPGNPELLGTLRSWLYSNPRTIFQELIHPINLSSPQEFARGRHGGRRNEGTACKMGDGFNFCCFAITNCASYKA